MGTTGQTLRLISRSVMYRRPRRPRSQVSLRVFALDGVDLGNPALVAIFGQLAAKPRANDLPHKLRRNLSAKGQHVCTIVLAAVSRRSFVVTHRCPHTGHLVCDHARADSCTVDDDSKIATPAGNGSRCKMCVVRIINRFSRVSAEILIFVSKLRQHALDLFLHLEAPVIRTKRNLASASRGSPDRAVELYSALSQDVFSKRG